MVSLLFANKAHRRVQRGWRLYRVTMRDTETNARQWSEVVRARTTDEARQIVEAGYRGEVGIVGVVVLSPALQKRYTKTVRRAPKVLSSHGNGGRW